MADQNKYYEGVLLDAIRSDDKDLNSPKEKAQYSYDRFKSEYGHEIQRFGESKALANWLSGLAIDIPFYNNEILDMAKKQGAIPENATEGQEQKILDNYWNFMGNHLRKLWKKYKVK